VEIKKVEPAPSDKRFNKFKLGKFLNSVPVFSKDKRGLNIPILIIQILFMIIRKDYDNAINRIEAIEKYCVRHLRMDEHFRSNCFIKMLLEIPKSSFHQAAVKRKTQKLLDKLKATPQQVVNQIHEIEIIPYEVIWDYIMESMETKFYKSSSSL